MASPGAVPRPLTRCSAPPGAARARDLRRLSRFLRETTVNPHYCSSCRSGPRIALLRFAAAVLSAGSRRGQGPNLATTAPADDRCQEGACARGRTWVRECVYAFMSVKERVCVCVRAEGVSPAPGALGGELRAKPEPAALPGAGLLHGWWLCWCCRGRRRRALRLVAVVQKMFLFYSRPKNLPCLLSMPGLTAPQPRFFFFFFPFSTKTPGFSRSWDGGGGGGSSGGGGLRDQVAGKGREIEMRKIRVLEGGEREGESWGWEQRKEIRINKI